MQYNDQGVLVLYDHGKLTLFHSDYPVVVWQRPHLYVDQVETRDDGFREVLDRHVQKIEQDGTMAGDALVHHYLRWVQQQKYKISRFEMEQQGQLLCITCQMHYQNGSPPLLDEADVQEEMTQAINRLARPL